MGNTNGQCQHSPLDQFDNPCEQCPEWPADQPFCFGGGGLMSLLVKRTKTEQKIIDKKMRQKRKREQLRNKFKCDDCSNAVFLTEQEYLDHCMLNYHGKYSVVNSKALEP
jgi:hypothetical protein